MRLMNSISWVFFLIFWGYVGYRFVALEHISTGEKLHIVAVIAVMYLMVSIATRMLFKFLKIMGSVLSGKVKYGQSKEIKFLKKQNNNVFLDGQHSQEELIKRHPEWFLDTYEGISLGSQLDNNG